MPSAAPTACRRACAALSGAPGRRMGCQCSRRSPPPRTPRCASARAPPEAFGRVDVSTVELSPQPPDAAVAVEAPLTKVERRVLAVRNRFHGDAPQQHSPTTALARARQLALGRPARADRRDNLDAADLLPLAERSAISLLLAHRPASTIGRHVRRQSASSPSTHHEHSARLAWPPLGNDGLVWRHCDGLIWPHFVRPVADGPALIERGSGGGQEASS